MEAAQDKYVVGSAVKLTCRFQDPVTKDYIEPGAVTVEVMDPNGVTTTPVVSFASELETPDGVSAPGYYVEVDVELPGTWYYRFAATGSGQAASEGSFYVEISNFAA